MTTALKSTRPSHIKGKTCPCCKETMKLSSAVDNVFEFVWVCECGHYLDHRTETTMVDYIPIRDQKYAMRWDWQVL